MRVPFCSGLLCVLHLVVCGVGAVSAQNYPVKPVRVVTTFPGSGNDFAARLIAQGLAAAMGQPAIVENRPSGVIVVDAVAKALPDGYTLLLYSDGLWILPLMQEVRYHPLKDFAAITLVARTPHVVVVHPSVPVSSVKELIAHAKAKSGELNFGSSVPSSSSNLAAELFKSMAGINIVRVSYKGTGQAVTAVIANEVQLMFSVAPGVTAHLKSGALKGLAVTSAQPSALVPGLPTVTASGLPGYEAILVQGLFAPARTPASLVARLNQEVVNVLKGTGAKDRMLALGLEVVASTPDVMTATIASEMNRMGKIIKNAGIRAD